MTLPVMLVLIGSLTLINIVTAALFVWDKRAAQRGRWRVSERTLLLWSMLGGWPAAITCGRRLRHKTSKTSFRIKFAVVTMLHIVTVAATCWFTR